MFVSSHKKKDSCRCLLLLKNWKLQFKIQYLKPILFFSLTITFWSNMKTGNEKYISFFLLVIFILSIWCSCAELETLQIQKHMDKLEAGEKELKGLLNEINTLKVDSWIITKVLFQYFWGLHCTYLLIFLSWSLCFLLLVSISNSWLIIIKSVGGEERNLFLVILRSVCFSNVSELLLFWLGIICREVGSQHWEVLWLGLMKLLVTISKKWLWQAKCL